MNTVSQPISTTTIASARLAGETKACAAAEVSLFRLYLLRATYLLIAVGLGSMIWPVILQAGGRWSHMHGVALALLAGLSAMAALGVRTPLEMLPVLLFELTWKSIWLATIALPRWLAGELDAAMMSSVIEIGLGLVLFAVIPWRYCWARYVRAPGDRWK